MKEEAKTIYDAIRQDLIRIHANWKIFKQLFTVSDDRFVIMNNTAPAFFRLIQDVLVDDAVISLSRLVDPSSDNTLLRLVRMLKAQVNHSFYSELEQDLSEVRLICEDIRQHRHKRVAHRIRTSKHTESSDHPIKLPKLTRNKIEGAMNAIALFMNKVLGYFEDVDEMFEPFMAGDADSLLLFLEKGYEATRPHNNLKRTQSA
jgi:hypothetical protein